MVICKETPSSMEKMKKTAIFFCAEQAKLHAETEYEKYRVIQDRLYESDFDRFLMLEQEVNHKDEV